MATKRESVDKDQGELFETLLQQVRGLDEEDEAFWDIVWLLSQRADQETFEKAFALTGGDAFERSFGALILGRFDAPQHLHLAEIIDRLLEMLRVESNDDVIESLISSLGQQEQDGRIPAAICRFLHHPDEDVRWFLAMTLAGYETPEAVETLIVLSRDLEVKVRDWATFGLGQQCDLDTPEIRAAFCERLSDEDDETRAEAIVGLAKRHDPRVVEAIRHEFEVGVSNTLIFDALVEMPDNTLLPALREMLSNPGFESWHLKDIEAAIAACEAHSQDHEN